MINNRIKYARENKYMTQKEMADLLNVARSTYSEYENGCTRPSIEKLCTIAQICGVSLDYLFNLTNDRTQYAPFNAYNKQVFLNNIKNLRITHHYTQKQLGNFTTYDSSTISRYETGYTNISLEFIKKISKLYKTPSDYIVGVARKNNSTYNDII